MDLINLGLCENQTFPSRKDIGNRVLIGTTNMEYALFLKSIPYPDLYEEARSKKFYNMQMIDGALISLSYDFENDRIIRHRLSFFPAPHLGIFQNTPDLYLEDELYADIVDVRIFPVPIRFDYDDREGVAIPIEHPISHLTLGQYEFCRIPVLSALTPHQFILFIIRNFYTTENEKYYDELTHFTDKFECSMFDEEFGGIHMVIA
jgi:hypothetical protein